MKDKLSKIAWIKGISSAFLFFSVIVLLSKMNSAKLFSLIMFALALVFWIYSLVLNKNLSKKEREEIKQQKLAIHNLILVKAGYVFGAGIILMSFYAFFSGRDSNVIYFTFFIGLFILGLAYLMDKTLIPYLIKNSLKKPGSNFKKK
ncbi:hypothetical protein J4466_04815 [Candidatus Pacearchaeota archaeon]|nr:hypothetical protein [Candidatus Pacearchaeota archaeon]